ncbi:hypothetical protein F7725_012057 [Dissostichus mawsoni]|uniref:Uncharacterized protein n=1 Tax=Dissostichus mawsoni TaxID=36200 RepID=A0A7J5ZAW2_DISMA|nr:hypothetical protein F7725_012057 [Dissostichus mawsoni]
MNTSSPSSAADAIPVEVVTMGTDWDAMLSPLSEGRDSVKTGGGGNAPPSSVFIVSSQEQRGLILLYGLSKAIGAVWDHQGGCTGNHPVVIIKEMLLQHTHTHTD